MNLLESSRGRRALFCALYFMEGAPIGFVWWALPAIAVEAGAEPEAIGALGATLGLPWVLKFLWAPLVDVLRGPRWSFRAWIVACQLVMAATLVPLAFVDLGRLGAPVLVPLVVHAFAAATQDVAIDGLAVRAVPRGERGAVNGWMNAGMMSARAIFGASTLILVDRLGGRVFVLLVAGLLASGTLLALLYARPEDAARNRGARLREFARAGRRALARRETWLGLAFAALAGAGFEATAFFAGPYFEERGPGKEPFGFFLAAIGTGAMIVGGLAGGRLADRIGRVAAAGLSVVLVAAAVGAVALAAATVEPAPSGTALFALLGVVYLGIGLLTASSYALFMDLSDSRLGATQFSAYMGATNACEAWSSAAAGRIVGARGYPTAFASLAAASLLALPVLALLRRRGSDGSVEPLDYDGSR